MTTHLEPTEADTARSRDPVGPVAIVAGAAFAVGALGGTVTEWAWLIMIVGFACLAYAAPGLHHAQAPADKWMGSVGARLVAFGSSVIVLLSLIYGVWELIGDPGEPAWAGFMWMVAFFCFVVGVVLFAVGTMVAGRLPRAAAGMMLVGLVAGVAIDMVTGAFFDDSGETTEVGLFIGVPLFGLGLVWLGVALVQQRRPLRARR